MADVVARARAAVGARFRLGGRVPETGLDCVGLVAWALELADVPTGYGLRGGDPARLTGWADARLARADGAGAGEVLLFRAGPGQLHLAIGTGGGIVHADAALGRVVERASAPWPLIAAWQAEARGEG